MKEYIVTEHPDFPYEEPKPQELIRCKDCIHYTGKWCTKYSTKEIDINDICRSDNDFCSQAERKE